MIFLVKQYVKRLAIYLLGAIVGGVTGSMLLWTTDAWSDVNPITGGAYLALYFLGPAAVIVALANLRRTIVHGIAAGAAIATVISWILFTSNESSTSAIVFLWGWVIGIPAACVLVIASYRDPKRHR